MAPSKLGAFVSFVKAMQHDPTSSVRLEPIEVIDTDLLKSMVQQATHLLHASGSAFYLCDPARDQTELAAIHGLARIPWDGGLVTRVAESQRAVTTTCPGEAAVLAVPSTWHDKARGVLVVADVAGTRRFREQDASLLQPIAELIAAVLLQAERLTRMTAQFRALHVIDMALTSSLELDRVLSLILEKAVDLVGAEHGSLRLLNPETGELALKAYLGDGWTPEVRAYTFRLGQGITGWVAEHRQAYLYADAHHDPRNIVLFKEMQSGVAVPLLSGLGGEPGRDELLGVLLLESTRPAAFDHQDVELLEALAQEAVIAIQNATQHHELQSIHRALQDEQEHRVAAEKWTVMGQAATALAHRINNLIGLVPTSAVEIRRTLAGLEIPRADREWIEANLDRIERNGRFVLRLADALFRPFQDTGPRARFDVNRVLNEALQAANLAPSVRVLCEYGQDLPAVESSSLLVDIFVELFTNAQKATEGLAPQWLRVCTWTEADETGMWVTVEVSDSGRGIPPEQMAHLWDMFKPSANGLGFGLWWVRTFIERHGGTIACDSEPGTGATFTIRLPACVGAAPLES
jgi:signal transduction histidine kinase